MSIPNDTTKGYMRNTRRFADAFNYLLYDGEQVIQPENLTVEDITEVLAFRGRDNKLVSAERYRDILKAAELMVDGKQRYLLLGIENQAAIHYAMPVRNMLYDALNYATQVSDIAKANKGDAGSGAEFLSGYQKKDHLAPLITLVIYWSDGKWDGPRSVHEMLDIKDKHLLEFIPDYKLNLIVPGEMKMEAFDKFSTELKDVLRFISVEGKRQRVAELMEHYGDRYSRLDKDSREVLEACTDVTFEYDSTTGRYDMCKAWDDQYKYGQEEGRKEGRAEGRREEKKDTVLRLFDLGISIEKISAGVEESEETVTGWLREAGKIQ